jgi:hypothetical protein
MTAPIAAIPHLPLHYQQPEYQPPTAPADPTRLPLHYQQPVYQPPPPPTAPSVSPLVSDLLSSVSGAAGNGNGGSPANPASTMAIAQIDTYA